MRHWAISFELKLKLMSRSLKSSSKPQKERIDTERTPVGATYPFRPRTIDSSQEESDSLFDDKLLPADKNKIMRLRKEIKRIKGGQTYPTGYEKDRAREIKQAEENRLAKLPVPDYLEPRRNQSTVEFGHGTSK